MASGIVTAVALASLASGCSYGMTAERFTPAHEPAGAVVELQTGAGPLSGELIEVADSGLVVLAGKTLRRVPYSAISSGHLAQTKITVDAAHIPQGDRRERLRLLSRYPQGLTPELLRALLTAYGQAELAGLQP
jgi:hypothetical protein